MCAWLEPPNFAAEPIATFPGESEEKGCSAASRVPTGGLGGAGEFVCVGSGVGLGFGDDVGFGLGDDVGLGLGLGLDVGFGLGVFVGEGTGLLVGVGLGFDGGRFVGFGLGTRGADFVVVGLGRGAGRTASGELVDDDEGVDAAVGGASRPPSARATTTDPSRAVFVDFPAVGDTAA